MKLEALKRAAAADPSNLKAHNAYMRALSRVEGKPVGEYYGVEVPLNKAGGEEGVGWWLSCRGAGVEVKHKATGLRAYHGAERSRTMNKVMAFNKLKALLAFHNHKGPRSVDVGLVRDWTEEELLEAGR